ncbi:MAG: c-type cytochrome [Pirellulales bacterium]|nr:c-type cytochrome [Pirellulales bacterium]
MRTTRRTSDGRLACAAAVGAACLLICLAAVQTGPARLPAAEPEEDLSAELPRIPPVEPAEALDTFVVQPGFQLEVVAAEPLVNDPVAVDFDADGRMYVAEMRGYSEQASERISRIRLLTDTDGDGCYDHAEVFADSLAWPTALICYGDGLFVADAPDILFLQDRDGDGRADERRVVLTGLGTGNVQGLVNSFRWGLDNRIHAAGSSNGGALRPAAAPEEQAVSFRGRDFAFDPRSLAVEATSGGAQHGMCFDDVGRKYVCSNSDHVQQVMYEDRYVARNPYLIPPSARLSIAADGPQAEVYRSSPVEPWRVVRTRLRVAGLVPGPVEGGGRAAGYFTSATGITILRGSAWPEGLRGMVVVGDVGSNIVHRKRLEPRGLEFVARRIDAASEWVASRDIWFRPAQFANAPDGSLYILDVYREVIEHPDSLPPVIKRHLDLTSGRDRGRIYRLAPAGFRHRPPPRLSQATTAELAALLAHDNAWHRETAQRLIFERQDTSVVQQLEQMVRSCDRPLGRLHALYALQGLGKLHAETLLAALRDPDPHVRRHAVRLSEDQAATAPELAAQLCAMTADPDAEVRYQLAFSLGYLPGPGSEAALLRLARDHAHDRWMRLAIQSSSAKRAAALLVALLDDAAFRAAQSSSELLAALARQVGLQQEEAEVVQLMQAVERLAGAEAALARTLVASLAEGLAAQQSPLAALLNSGKSGELLARLLHDAQRLAVQDDAEPQARVAAISKLALGTFDATKELYPTLLASRQPQEVQLAALQVLGRFDEAAVAEIILEAWPGLTPRVRVAATEALLARPDRAVLVLEAIDAGAFPSSELEPARLRLLAEHGDERLRTLAQTLLQRLALGRRQDVVAAYQHALTLPGDAARGKEVFKKVCAACHRLEGVGFEIGPNLATLKNRGPETILVNVLDPSREVNPQYLNYVLVTTDGRVITGLLADETASSVTLKRAENISETVLRVNIDELRSSGLSLMPEGMEKDVDPQAMADLIAYLLSLK